jgi:hypothetical protein
MATVKCPACDRSVEVDDAYRDWTVRCPHCEAEFVPDDVARPSARRRPRDDEDDDDEPYGAASGAREEALQLVSAPAAWLEVCGWLGALASVGIAALYIGLAVMAANMPNPNPNDDSTVMLVLFGCYSGVVGLPYNVALAIGARKMRTLSSRQWALAAAILSVASFSVFSCCGLIHTGIGVWALITLEKPVVREAFGLPVRRRRRRRD